MKIIYGVIITLCICILGGCSEQELSSALQYKSKDGKCIIFGPNWTMGKLIDGTTHYPVTINKEGFNDKTIWCELIDHGSSGNFTIQSKDKDFRLSDSSFCHSDDMDCIIYVDFISGSTTNRICLDRISQ